VIWQGSIMRGFRPKAAGIHTHHTVGITAVHDMVFMQLVWLPDWHTKLFGNLDLFINGGLFFVEPTTMFKFVFFVTHDC
jgi:hypothetical protein